jgi:hypothetical protein
MRVLIVVFLPARRLFRLFACGGVGVCLIWLPARRFLSVLLRRWPFLDLFAYAALVRLSAYGVGLSLISYWFISVAPVRGGHLLFFACRKEK